MTAPTYGRFIEPLLRFLAENPDGVAAKVVHESPATALGLTDEDRLQMLTSGKLKRGSGSNLQAIRYKV